MSEYIIEIPDEYFSIADKVRDMYYPDERDNAMPIAPLVQCRDCKYYHPEMYNNINCEWFMFDVEPDGYCAWGERKENGE